MYPYNLERVQALNSEDYLRMYIHWLGICQWFLGHEIITAL